MTNQTSKHLKVVQKGYEGFTGPIGAYDFVDGVSVEKIPLHVRDRLSAAFQMIEVEDDGSDSEALAGVASRLVLDRKLRLERTDPLPRQSAAEKAAENVRAVVGNEKIKPLYTQAVLEAVASDKGIAGVRELAAVWGVRSKSIPDLIGQIINAQSVYVNERVALLVEKGAKKDDVEKLFVLSDEAPADAAPAPVANEPGRLVKEPAVEPEAPVIDGPIVADKIVVNPVLEAAATGDLAAALNATDPAGEDTPAAE